MGHKGISRKRYKENFVNPLEFYKSLFLSQSIHLHLLVLKVLMATMVVLNSAASGLRVTLNGLNTATLIGAAFVVLWQ